MQEIRRGDIFFADLGQGVGSEQMGKRPVVVLQNDIGNKFSSTVIIAAITSNGKDFVTHLIVGPECGLKMDSAIELEQIRTIDKRRLLERIGHIPPEIMELVNEKLDISFGRETKEKGGGVLEKLITIQNVSGFIDENGIAHLSLENVARGLGFTQMKNGYEYVRWERVYEYLESFEFSPQVGKENFIPENIFYLLAMKANNETAIAFQMKVASEILPSIRKTGTYSVQSKSALEALQDTVKVLTEHESRLNKLDEKVDNEIRITFNQAKEIQFNVSIRVIELLGGKDSPDYRNYKGSYFQQLHHDLKDRLGVPSYRDIRKLDYNAALAYIKAWLPKAVDKSA
jgi:mRNA-degrading endonuclease toxin of MazEF toxin-antitoxin module/prophage antirepressor-like protein